MDNKELIRRFYGAFAARDAAAMTACYAEDVVFTDPAFGQLHGDDAKAMWHMLLQNNGGIHISVSDIEADEHTGSAEWVAEYTFSRTGRKVVNRVKATFQFSNGKISRHTDHFSLWRWAGQALGISGYLLGWTPLMRNKIQKQTKTLLAKYKAAN